MIFFFYKLENGGEKNFCKMIFFKLFYIEIRVLDKLNFFVLCFIYLGEVIFFVYRKGDYDGKYVIRNYSCLKFEV